VRRMSRFVAAIALALGVGSCRDTTGPAPSVFVTVAGSPSLRAVQFRLVGTQTAIVPVLTGSQLFTSLPAGDTITVVVIAPAGQVLSGAIARVTVPDQSAALHDDVVTLRQVAAPDYSLLNPLAYTITLQASLPQ
jgi:hypothetical protein